MVFLKLENGRIGRKFAPSWDWSFRMQNTKSLLLRRLAPNMQVIPSNHC